jgi:hypothetical protein
MNGAAICIVTDCMGDKVLPIEVKIIASILLGGLLIYSIWAMIKT